MTSGSSGTMAVLAPGLQTTVQDLGRWGHQAIGVAVAGAMDPFAHRLANALVGNSRDAATLEVTLLGPRLQFHDARTVAVAGARFDLMVDDRTVPYAEPFGVSPGAVLTFGARRHGSRAYLAVGGGIDVPRVLGSRATHLPTGMGGMNGRPLGRGDLLPLGAHAVSGAGPRGRVPNPPPADRGDSGPIGVRVLPGPQDGRFMSDALGALVSAPYTVGADSNRMGFRLEGPLLRHRTTADIISDATPLGSIQVPGAGQPLLLMADRQTTGGYAKLATVISADIGVAAQAAPGGSMQFVLCTAAEAVAALLARERVLLAVESDS